MLVAIRDRRHALVDHAGFAGADGVQALRAGRAALRGDVELLVAPVRRHLPAAGIRIVLGADRREQHLERRHAERQAQRAIAVVRIEPVVSGPQVHAGRGQHGFVSRAADLEKDQALVLELDFLVVDAPRQEHRAIRPQQIVRREALPPGAESAAAAVRASGLDASVEAFMSAKIISPGPML